MAQQAAVYFFFVFIYQRVLGFYALYRSHGLFPLLLVGIVEKDKGRCNENSF